MHSFVHEVTMLVDYTGNGLKDSIWGGDGKLSEMGLYMPSKVIVDRSIKMSLRLTVSEECFSAGKCSPELSLWGNALQNEALKEMLFRINL